MLGKALPWESAADLEGMIISNHRACLVHLVDKEMELEVQLFPFMHSLEGVRTWH